MPQDSNKAKANQGFTPQPKTIDQPTEPPLGGQVLSAQMVSLIQSDQSALQVMGQQLEQYGEQRTNAVVTLFQNVIAGSNAAIEHGVRGVNRGLSADFLTETGVFFDGFKTLKSAQLQAALPSTTMIEAEVM
jgi:ABC-type Fe3+ transport system substrate-binding protein